MIENCTNINTTYSKTENAILPSDKLSIFKLKRKSQLNKIITDGSGLPDYLAINIYYDTLRSWYVPNKLKLANGSIVEVSKLKTKGIFLSYKKLQELYSCSTETLRKKLVKLEKLGLIQRSFKHRENSATKSYNQLIIYVLKENKHFFNNYGISLSEISELKPQTNHQYIANKYNVDYEVKHKINQGIEQGGGIHKLEGTKELREPFNKLKDRSKKSNFIDKDLKEDELKTPDSLEESGKPSKPRVLGDFYPLNKEDCRKLQKLSGREFCLIAMNEILKNMSNRIVKAKFWSKKGFMSYMSKAFRYEMRDAVKTNNESFKIKANYSDEENQINKQEKYLSEIESSLQVNPEWHLKKKLASVLERSKAYKLLTSYKILEIEKDGLCRLELSNAMELTSNDQQIILNQIKATHEKTGIDSFATSISELEIIMPKYKKESREFLSNSLNRGESLNTGKIPKKKQNIWDQIREILAKQYGEGIDQAWFSKLKANINDSQKEIRLKSSNEFIIDWITNNYSQTIKNIASGFEFKLTIENN